MKEADMTVGWKPQILSEIGDREEIRISSERTGGGYNRWTPVWVVRVGDDLYVQPGRAQPQDRGPVEPVRAEREIVEDPHVRGRGRLGINACLTSR